MIKRIYEAVTGTPWTTGRSATADFGPTPAAAYPELDELSFSELMTITNAEAIAWAKAQRASVERIPAPRTRAALSAVR
jgi:hypothetical protein